MDIVIDLTSLQDMLFLPPYLLMWKVFLYIGWIPFALFFLWAFKELWLTKRRGIWGAKAEFTFLAIDIPKGNEQTPKAVENMFTYIAGAHGSLNLIETYWEGKYQLSFSFEIVSIEGYTQFIVRTPVQFRNLVESAVYSQYPDAEITEIDDYTEGIPTKFPDEEYDVWGTEFLPVKKWVYPIKTYEEFEHQLQTTSNAPGTYKDTMASLMDLYSSLGPGEQLWHQIIVIPTGFDWPEEGDKEISKILGEKVNAKKNIADYMIDWFLKALDAFSEAIIRLWSHLESSEDKSDDTLKMMNLKPKEKKQVEAIQEKVSKLGFECKIRMVYVAKKDVINKAKAANGFVGYMKQFAYLDINNLKPDVGKTMTTTAYLFAKQRLNIKKSNIVRNYINRDDWAGRLPFILNIEELATLWHFPLESAVKAPLIQKTPGRKSEPPMSLPIGQTKVNQDTLEPIFEENEQGPGRLRESLETLDEQNQKVNQQPAENNKSEEDAAPPSNLPIV